METLRTKLEEKIQQCHMLTHTFYTRWQAGKLEKAELQGYAKEYYADGRPGPMTFMQLNRAAGIEEPRLQTAP